MTVHTPLMHLAQLGTPAIKPLGMQKSPSGHGLVVVGLGVGLSVVVGGVVVVVVGLAVVVVSAAVVVVVSAAVVVVSAAVVVVVSATVVVVVSAAVVVVVVSAAVVVNDEHWWNAGAGGRPPLRFLASVMQRQSLQIQTPLIGSQIGWRHTQNAVK